MGQPAPGTRRMDDRPVYCLHNMSQAITILVGLPGSGKTWFLKQHSDVVFDDFHACAFRNSPAITASRHYGALRNALQQGKNCIIADIAYCSEDRLQAVQDGIRNLAGELNIGLEIQCLYFANDVNACRHNVVHRYSQEPERDYLTALRSIDEFSKSYAPPPGCRPVQTCCRGATK